MAININTVTGRITKDLEIVYTQSGKEYVNFTVAVPNDNKEKDPIWMFCKAWNSLAQLLVKYCSKGTKVTISGKNAQYKDEETNRYITYLEVKNIDIIFENKNEETNYNEVEKKQTTKNEIIDDDDFPF